MDEHKKKIWKEISSKPEFMIYDSTLGLTQLRINGDTPSFFESPIAWEAKDLEGIDAAFVGIPWEGLRHMTPTGWVTAAPHSVNPESIMERGSASEAPAWIRQNSVRYSLHVNGGYFPEVGPDVRLLENLKIMDYRDVEVKEWDVEEIARRAIDKVSDIVKAGAKPLVIGGDHSIPYPVVKAISDNSDGKIGIICFDAHYDNMYGGPLPYPHGDLGRLNAGNAFYRIFEACNTDPENWVFIGIKEGGAFNTSLMHELSTKLGVTMFTATDVIEKGMKEIVSKAIDIAAKGTDKIYVSLDSDSLDPVEFPAQKAPDPWGLPTRQVMEGLKVISRETNLAGFDLVCMAPAYDLKGISALTSCKFFLEILKGLVIRKIKKS